MKAQAALEFLMTYGWAILIVIAVVAALYAMGVFTLPTGGLGKCSPCFPAGSAFAYSDHNADELVVTVGPSAITSTTSATVAGRVGPATAKLGSVFTPGGKVTYTGVAGLFATDAVVTIAYTDAGSLLTHTVVATLHNA